MERDVHRHAPDLGAADVDLGGHTDRQARHCIDELQRAEDAPIGGLDVVVRQQCEVDRFLPASRSRTVSPLPDARRGSRPDRSGQRARCRKD